MRDTGAPLCDLQFVLQQLVDASDEMLACLTTQGSITFANARAVAGLARLSGRPADAILGFNFRDLLPASLADEYARLATQVLETGGTASSEVHFTFQGDTEWRRIRLLPVRTPEGSIAGILACTRDITLDTRFDRSLRDRESTLSLSEQTAHLGSLILDITRDHWDCSTNMFEVLGFDDTGDRSIQVWSTLIHPEDRPDVLRYFHEDVITDGQPFDREYRIIKPKTGEVRWVWGLGRLRQDPNSGSLLFVGTIQDIHKHKLAEIEQRATEERFRALFETMSEGMALHELEHDPDGNPVNYRILDANPALEKHTGVRVRDIRGQLATEAWRVDTAPYLDVYARVVRLRTPETFETYFPPLDRHFRVSVFPFQERCFATVFTDISEAVRSHTERQRIQAQLAHSARLASIGTLAAGVAHEINNPLAVIKGNIELLQLNLAEASPPIQNCLAVQNRACDRIIHIVNSLRSFARTDSQQVEVIDLHAAIRDTLSMFGPIFRKSAIEFEIALEAPRSQVLANAGRIQQVILNLLTNAKDALADRPSPRIRISSRLIDGVIEVSVSDNGAGIAHEHLPHIFDPFFSTKEQGKGTGLGLAISHSIIEEFRGSLSVDSEVGIGTTVLVTLPLSQFANARGETGRAATPPRFSGTVLVVDDEEDIRNTLKSHLGLLGLSVLEAADGAAAIQLLEKHPVDYLITDLKMPVMSGDRLLEHIRTAMPAVHERVYSVVITGGLVTEYSVEQREILRACADGFLQKPFNLDALVQSLAARGPGAGRA